MWDPWEHLDGLTVGHSPLVQGGRYFPSLQLVVLGTSMTGAAERSALAHELGHHYLGHRPSPVEADAARMEVRARKWAAVRLVSIGDLARAMTRADSWDEVCDELEVDPDLLEIRIESMTDTERRELAGLVGQREVEF